MKSIYKIAAVGILLVAAIAFISAKAFSAPKDSPIVIDTSVNVIDGFFAENIKDSTISDEGASYSGEQWLNSEGEVTHPQWFEGDKLIMADGSYYLIKAYPAPDYYYSGSGEFSDTIDIGNTESENGNLFEYVNASEPQVREMDGNTYTYRTLSKNGAMVLNLSCSPDSVNYLTVRLWGGDTGDTMLWVCDPVSGNMNETDSEQPHRNAGVADGEADISRREAWILMLEKARDYLIDINGGFGHAPNQDMANSIAALCFDKAIEKLGGRTLSKSGAGAVFDRCFGVSKNPLTSGYWVSPKGTILENFGSVQGGYSGDYGSNAVAEMSQLAEIAKAYYGYDYEAYMERVYDTIDKYYFTGKRLENGEFFAQEYTEGIISNRNAYYSGTERYPIDIYSALELGNDTALKIISNYITQKDISSLMSGGKELDVSNVHFEDSVIDAAHMYRYFDEITKAAQERNIAGYDFLMDDGDVSSYAWADEMARNVIIKDGDEKIYMALNWRNPAHSNKIYSPGEQEIMANDLCRVHASNGVYDSYGYAGMTTDGYETWTAVSGTDGCMEALMTVQYGQYTVIMNSYNCGSSGNARDFKASDFEKDAGLDRDKSYMDMMTGAVYGYSGGYWHSGGNIMQVKSNSTLVLKAIDVHASRPVVSNGKASSVVTNNTDSAKSVVLYAAQYDESGALIDAFDSDGGYQAFLCYDLSRGKLVHQDGFETPDLFRHGTVMPITADEYDRLIDKFGIEE